MVLQGRVSGVRERKSERERGAAAERRTARLAVAATLE
jgi:hypothetical protein